MDNKEEVKTTETKTVDTGKKNPFRAVNVEDKTTSTKTPEVSATVTEVKKEEERIDVSRDLDEHLKENEDKIRYKINFKDVLAVIILFIIVIACVFLIVDFFDKHSYLFKASTTTTTRGIFKTTTTTSKQGVITIKTTSMKTAATHEVWQSSRHTQGGTTGISTSIIGSTNDRTFTIKPGKTTTQKVIDHNTTTTTSEVVDNDDENNSGSDTE